MNFLKNLVGKFLGRQDIISILKGFLIAEVGAMLATATLWFQLGKFDFHILLAMETGTVASVFVNFVRKLVDGKVE